MHRELLRLCLVACAIFLAGCAQPDDGPNDAPAGNGGSGGNGDTIVISGFSFHPDELEVPLGTTVIWTNDDDFDHTATADDESWDVGMLTPG
jgi:plastocyanin